MAGLSDTSVIETELSTPVGDGGGMFCGQHAEGYSINGTTYQWPRGSKLKWALNFSRLGQLSADDIISCVKKFLKDEFDSTCDIFHEYVTNPNVANILLTNRRLDGASGVLADMQIPVGNVNTDSTQLIGRFDDSENWGLYENPPANTIDFERTAKHEWEHALGLGHRPPSVRDPALIAPIYSPTMRNLQPADKEELIRRYGPAKAAIPPATGTRSVNYKSVVEIEQDGKLWRGPVSGILQRVV